jgi:hypothetical protein
MALAKPPRTRRISTKLRHQNLDRGPQPATRASRRRSSAATRAEPPFVALEDPDDDDVVKPEPLEAWPPPHRVVSVSASTSKAVAAAVAAPVSEKDEEEDPAQVLGKRQRKPVKPKPDTYKQAWTVEEQNTLERLMEQYPETEDRRCVSLPLYN